VALASALYGVRWSNAVTNAAIRFEHVTKCYGAFVALHDLSLEVARGEIYGFLGPNGAGKTTAIRILLDLIRPNAGRALVLGHDAQRESLAVRSLIGYLPGELSLYDDVHPRAFLDFISRLRGGSVDPRTREELAERFQLPVDKPMGSLSTGQRQKVGVVMAFMHQPSVLILDEPTSGLDPIMRQVLLDTLVERASAGATVFLSSHVLSEVQEVCTRVAILREGRLIDEIDVGEGRRLAPQRVTVLFADQPGADAFAGLAGVSVEQRDGARVALHVTHGMDGLLKRLAGYTVLELDAEQPSLEELVLSYYGDAAPKMEGSDAGAG
jgi:ABC-2 type transport system ATP-binding protein